MKRAILSILIIFTFTFLAGSVYAQEGEEADWGEFINPDGSINFDTLTYVDTVTEQADWMSIQMGGINIPVGEAKYGRYVTPSGQVLVIPSLATVFFSSVNPVDSGLINSQPDAIMHGGGATLANILGAVMGDATIQDISHEASSMGYEDANSFFQAVVDGKENLWTTLKLEHVSKFLMGGLWEMTQDTGILANALWLYNANNCASVPGGCPEELLALLTTPTPAPTGTTPPAPTREPEDPPECPSPFATTGPIRVYSPGGDSGGKKAPLNPFVVGQDPEKRGTDVEVAVQVPPVVYYWFVAVQHVEADEDGNILDTWWECVEQTQIYPDYVADVQIHINLTGGSRSYILGHLAQAYPGAHLIHPDWSYAYSGPGSVIGGGAVLWMQEILGIQTADPGDYTTTVQGVTTGTPVSEPRSFSGNLGNFHVSLLRVSLGPSCKSGGECW